MPEPATQQIAASGPRDASLRARALAVVPGGMYGHMNAANLPRGYPQFFQRGEGCRIWDTDGNEYIDFMCAYGPISLGHRHPAVEDAVQRQMRNGDCFNGPGEVFVELAELLVDTIAAADWAMFCKNGNDATTWCVTIARAATGKRCVLVAENAYHGSLPWCTNFRNGVIDTDQRHVHRFQYNNIESLRDAAAACEGDLAALMVSPFRHDTFVDQEMPAPEFARAARQICDKAGAALIIDEVRAGFRLNLAGSWEEYGVRPDLSAWGKAMANGWPISAITGTDALRDAAKSVFATGSYWYGAIAMAAAIATIKTMREIDAVAIMRRSGQQLREGLAHQAAAHGFNLRQTGPVQMPQVLFDDDSKRKLGNAFVTEALKRGVFLHPWHNMFLCAAHAEDDIAAALERTDEAFAKIGTVAY